MGPAPLQGCASHRPTRATTAVLALLIAFALAVRLLGIGFLLPELGEPDGLVIDYQVRALSGTGPEHEAHALYGYYPHLVAHAAALVPGALVAPGEPRGLEQHWRAASASRLRARVAVALLSLLAVPLTFWLARRFLPDPWALLAAALAGTSLLVVWMAQQARPHAAAAALALLAVCAAVHASERGGWRAWVLAGAGAFLAIGSLQSGIAVLIPLAFAALLRWRADRWKALGGLAIAAALAALAVPALYPFLFQTAKQGAGMKPGTDTLALSGHEIFLGQFNGSGFQVVWRSLREYDPLLTVLGLWGLAAAIALLPFARRLGVRRAQALAIVLAHALPYLIAIGMYQRTYQRFALQLVPYVALLGAFGLWSLTRGAERVARPLRWIPVALALAAAVAQAAWSWRLSELRSREGTLREATRWVARNVKVGVEQVDVMPGVDLPLFHTAEARAANAGYGGSESMPWSRYLASKPPVAWDGPRWDLRVMPLVTQAERELAHSESYAFARSLRGRYAVIVRWPRNQRPALHAVGVGLRDQYERVARFAPDDPDRGEDLALVHQDDEMPYTTPWAWRILRARCTGPAVEIYRLR